MKCFKTILSSVMICGFLLILNSCGEHKETILMQTWKINDIQFSKEIPAEQKAFMSQMIEQMKANTRITYKKGGVMEVTFPGKVSNGKWELSSDAKKMTASDESGKKVTYDIAQLTKDTFAYSATENGEKVTFVLLPAAKK